MPIKGGGFERKSKTSSEIPSSSLADIAFLLLIFFMVTTVFRAPQTMEINLPPSEQKVDIAESNLMTFFVTENNAVFWAIGRERPQRVEMRDIQPLLAEKNKANPKLVTLIKLDRKARYHMMVDMLDELNIANVTRFSVAPMTDRDKEVLSKA